MARTTLGTTHTHTTSATIWILTLEGMKGWSLRTARAWKAIQRPSLIFSHFFVIHSFPCLFLYIFSLHKCIQRDWRLQGRAHWEFSVPSLEMDESDDCDDWREVDYYQLGSSYQKGSRGIWGECKKIMTTTHSISVLPHCAA